MAKLNHRAIQAMLEEAGLRAFIAVLTGRVSHEKAIGGLLMLRKLSYNQIDPEQLKLYLARNKMLKGTDLSWYPFVETARAKKRYGDKMPTIKRDRSGYYAGE